MRAESGVKPTVAKDEHDNGKKKSRLFDDLSIAQVLAGALAAVTSMLLASRIGIYGSVIGVAVGSVVSAVASQLYKKFLTASAEKLRELKPGDTGYLESVADGSATPESTSGGAGAEGEAAEPLREESPTERLSADKTAILRPVTARRSQTPRLDDDALEGDATVERVRARRERKRKLQRRIVVASIASALGAVLLSAVVVDLLTQGEGLGERPAPLVSSISERAPSAGDATAQQGAASKDSSGDNSAKSDDGAKDAKDEQGSSDSSDSATKPDADKGTADNPSGSGSNTGDSGSAGSGGAGTGGSESDSGSSGNTSGDGSGNSGTTGSEGGSGSGDTNNPSTPTKPGETTPSTSPTSAPAPSSR